MINFLWKELVALLSFGLWLYTVCHGLSVLSLFLMVSLIGYVLCVLYFLVNFYNNFILFRIIEELCV